MKTARTAAQTAWARAAAATVVHRVLHDGRSLDAALAATPDALKERDRPLVWELSYGVLRRHGLLAALATALLNRPQRAQDPLVFTLLLIGLYQMEHTRIPDYAAIGETVNAARLLNKAWASRLLNGALRHFQRQRKEMLNAVDDNARLCCPPWLLHRLRRDWPQHWRAIVEHNNTPPPLTLRLNLRRRARDEYLALLAAHGIAAQPCAASPCGVTLAEGRAAATIPQFAEGLVSVQDESAQLAAPLLAPRPGHAVLDACAAPGGKSCHLLELEPQIDLLAVDYNLARLLDVRGALQRTAGRASLLNADSTTLGRWWPASFDRILLDAPCSGTGAIARHPDIKHLRRENDLPEYVKIQRAMLQSCWALLKPGGRLVYISCSVLPEENNEQIQWFTQGNSDASVRPPEAVAGIDCGGGVQRLPGVHGADGFFYACLERT